MKIPKPDWLLPVVRVIDNVRRCCDAAHRLVMVVEAQETRPMPVGSLHLHKIRGDFFDYVLPVHISSENVQAESHQTDNDHEKH